MKNFQFSIFNFQIKREVFLFVLFFLSLLALLDLLHPGIFMGHDAPDHVARIANFYQSITEGNVVPRWAGNLNWGYGHPILMFLYPLSSYVGSIIHAVGFSFVDSVKLVFAFGFIASVAAMYWWITEAWGWEVGLVAAALYGFAPYRFIDLYVRGAIGEHMAFVFPPLLGLGLLWLAREKYTRGFLMTALASAGLMLAHNALALMFFPAMALYGLYLFFFESKRSTIYLLLSTIAVLLGVGMSAFFWAPAFFEGKYTLRDIVTKGEFAQRMVTFTQFFYSPWEYGGAEMTKSLGLIQWLGIGTAVMLFFRTKKKEWRWTVVSTLLLLLFTLFVMTDAALPLWKVVTLLQKFQFPWRFLSLTVLFTAFIAAMVMRILSPTHKKVALVVVFLFTLATYPMWHAKGYVEKPESYYSGIYDSTTDTGESSPKWSIRFMEHRYKAPLIIDRGNVQVKEVRRSSTEHVYEVTTDGNARLVENTVYFPGWGVWIDGAPVAVEFQDVLHRGLITFTVPQGTHRIEVVFGDTKLRTISNYISIASLAVFLIIAVIPGLTRNPVIKKWIPARRLG